MVFTGGLGGTTTGFAAKSNGIPTSLLYCKSLRRVTARSPLSPRRLAPRQQFGEVVVDAGHTEIRLAHEGLAQVVRPMRVSRLELDDGEDEVFGLFE